jgi:hypothetical protein
MGIARFKAEKTFETFFIPGTLMTGLRIITKIEIELIMSVTMIRTMISMAHAMTSPPDVILQLEATILEESSLSPMI